MLCATVALLATMRQVKMESQLIPDKTECLAEITLAIEAALGELYHYSRFGRYRRELQQRIYLILSRCGLLLSSLVAIEREIPGGIRKGDPALTALFARLYPEVPHDHDYRSRTSQTDDRETALAGDTRWFEFWGKVLRHAGQATTPQIEHFSERLLGCRVVGDLAHTRSSRRRSQALVDLLGSPETGQFFQHSVRILEDVTAAVTDYFARLDPAVHMKEQMQVLTCMLSQVRRTIVCKSMVKGPYSMRDDVGWQPSWIRRRVGRGRGLGRLTVAPVDESGELVCAYTCASGSGNKERSWSCAIAALPCTYEEMLFKTWSYETGEYLRIVDLFGQPEACWVVDKGEADQLETICKCMDGLLEKLNVHEAFHPVGGRLARLARSDQARWAPTELSWTFVRDLDRAIEGLRFACREVNVLGGDSSMADVLSRKWPCESPAPHSNAAVRTESSESKPEQPLTDDFPVDQSQVVDHTGQAPSLDDWPPHSEASIESEDERPKRARRRVEKLATTMNILLGESDKRKDGDSPSGA